MDLIEFCNRDEEKFLNCLQNILTDQISEHFNSEELADSVEKSVLTAVNTRLDKASTRCQGLKLLCSFAEKISKENLTKYLSHWISKLSQTLSNAPNGSLDLTLACQAIGAVVTSCKKVPELDKRVSMNNVKPVIGIIVDRYNKETDLALFNLLTVLLYHYPESCVRFQASYSAMIISCIDNGDQDFVASGAKCYSLLVRALERSFVHSSRENSILIPDNSSASCHISHQIDLCNCLSKIMDELFQEFVTEVCNTFYELKSTSNIHSLVLDKISCQDLLEFYIDTTNRFVNICAYLATLLRIGGSGGKKFTQPNVILQVICRGLAITPTNLTKSSDRNRDTLLLILPKLHSGLLQVLQSLIISFQQELIPFAVTIQRLILQCLECTQQNCSQSWVDIRICAYKTLSLWLKRTGSCSGFHLVADDFLIHILKDITPSNKDVLILKASKGAKNKSKSNKSKEKLKVPCSNDNSSTLSESTNIMIGTQVLATIQSVISSTNFGLMQSSYEKIQTSVVLLLYEHYVTKNRCNIPNISTDFRLQLIKAFRTLQAYTHGSSPSTLSYAIQIFGIAISQDSDPRIVEEATLGLAEIRPLIYPTAPTLVFPMSKPSGTRSAHTAEVTEETTKIIDCSSVNEASGNGSSITQSVPDEPGKPSKRPRIENDSPKKINSSATNVMECSEAVVAMESGETPTVMESSSSVIVKENDGAVNAKENNLTVNVTKNNEASAVMESTSNNGHFSGTEDEDMLTSFRDEVC